MFSLSRILAEAFCSGPWHLPLFKHPGLHTPDAVSVSLDQLCNSVNVKYIKLEAAEQQWRAVCSCTLIES